jgi:exosortase
MTATAAAASPKGDFRAEFAAAWAALPNKGFFLALLAAWLALFQFLGNSTFGYADTASLPAWMVNAYNAPTSDDGHGNIIPFVVLALFWWKRKRLLAAPLALWPPALGLVALALGLHVVGYLVQQPRISILAMFAGIYGLTGLAWGRAWLRESFFPFVLLAFCIPLGSLSQTITFPLRIMATIISVAVSHLLGIDVLREGTQMFDAQREFNYDVAPACSGIRSLIALLAMTVIYGQVYFRTGWKRLGLVAAAFPLAVAGNVLRLTLIIVTADTFGVAAGNFVHENWFFSLLPYVPGIGGLLLLARWWREPGEAKP